MTDWYYWRECATPSNNFQLHEIAWKAKLEDRELTDEETIEILVDLYPVDQHKDMGLFKHLSPKGVERWSKEVQFNTENEARNERLEELKEKCLKSDMKACEACKELMTHEEKWYFKLQKNIILAEERGDTERLAQLRSRKYPDRPL